MSGSDRTRPPRRLSHSRAATSPPLTGAPPRPDGPRSGPPGPFLRRPRPAPSSPEHRPHPEQRRRAPSPVSRRPAAVVAVADLRRSTRFLRRPLPAWPRRRVPPPPQRLRSGHLAGELRPASPFLRRTQAPATTVPARSVCASESVPRTLDLEVVFFVCVPEIPLFMCINSSCRNFASVAPFWHIAYQNFHLREYIISFHCTIFI